MAHGLWMALAVLLCGGGARAASAFQLPTANRALLDADGGAERYFVGTVGKPWTSGQFGCVRTDGRQFHEGMDIRPLRRDRRGEPLDGALAAAAGTVAYVNRRPSLSNYGNYVVVRHRIEGLEIFTLYAHLASVSAGLSPGRAVAAGESLGTVGRTSNTRQRITPDRAHLHFEINLQATDRYARWHRANLPDARNDHGDFNGQSLLGLDPAPLFREQAGRGTNFSLVAYVRSQPEVVRVLLKNPGLAWARRNPALVESNPVARREGIAAWEIHLAFNGAPLRLVPRAASELRGTATRQIVRVNEPELERHGCSRLVVRRGQLWTLTARGQQLLDQFAY
jgi:peptidoglycan LD-endopeptidase LytH